MCLCVYVSACEYDCVLCIFKEIESLLCVCVYTCMFLCVCGDRAGLEWRLGLCLGLIDFPEPGMSVASSGSNEPFWRLLPRSVPAHTTPQRNAPI